MVDGEINVLECKEKCHPPYNENNLSNIIYRQFSKQSHLNRKPWCQSTGNVIRLKTCYGKFTDLSVCVFETYLCIKLFIFNHFHFIQVHSSLHSK